jgi:hypothetical protein
VKTHTHGNTQTKYNILEGGQASVHHPSFFFQFCDVPTLAMFTRGIEQIWLQVRLEESREKNKESCYIFQLPTPESNLLSKYMAISGGFFLQRNVAPLATSFVQKKSFFV